MKFTRKIECDIKSEEKNMKWTLIKRSTVFGLSTWTKTRWRLTDHIIRKYYIVDKKEEEVFTRWWQGRHMLDTADNAVKTDSHKTSVVFFSFCYYLHHYYDFCNIILKATWNFQLVFPLWTVKLNTPSHTTFESCLNFYRIKRNFPTQLRDCGDFKQYNMYTIYIYIPIFQIVEMYIILYCCLYTNTEQCYCCLSPIIH